MKKYFEKITNLGLRPKVEILKLGALVLISIAIDAFLYKTYKITYILLGGILLPLLIVFLFTTRYDEMLKKKDERITDQFVQCFTYFQIYIKNGYNVYHAIEEIIPLSPKDIRPLFQALVEGIDQDKTLQPYIDFSSHFSSLSVQEVMLSIYQMVDTGGGGNYLYQFQTLFERFSEERHKLQKERVISELARMSILPLLGSGIVMLILAAALVQIMGEYYSVI